MKQTKWLKWKIGTIGTIGLAFLFHEVKISAAFDQAITDAAKDKTIATATIQDPIMEEFNSSVAQQGSQFDSQKNEDNQSNPSHNNQRSHTKTGRS